eukprot:TRINITY_DN48899_c0_g1_i1.p1 TRINITY_DN48899_c0_g1~~TRINITY_DN48899_c0_g1_i1.p1  ORF type:complete len:290 (+),score=37.90 TRINITY_DN48899_c0_g1_i1:106-975(+)
MRALPQRSTSVGSRGAVAASPLAAPVRRRIEPPLTPPPARGAAPVRRSSSTPRPAPEPLSVVDLASSPAAAVRAAAAEGGAAGYVKVPLDLLRKRHAECIKALRSGSPVAARRESSSSPRAPSSPYGDSGTSPRLEVATPCCQCLSPVSPRTPPSRRWPRSPEASRLACLDSPEKVTDCLRAQLGHRVSSSRQRAPPCSSSASTEADSDFEQIAEVSSSTSSPRRDESCDANSPGNCQKPPTDWEDAPSGGLSQPLRPCNVVLDACTRLKTLEDKLLRVEFELLGGILC